MANPETFVRKAQKRAPRAVPSPSVGINPSSEGIEDFFKIVRASWGFRTLDLVDFDLGDLRSVVEAVKRGVPVVAINSLIDHNVLTRSEIDTLVMPRRTLDHRKRRKEPLNAIESERVLRIARIVAIAEDTFANSKKAATWLRRPSRLFGGKAPLAMADTEPGGRMVEDVLQRIAHGIAA